MCQKGRQDVKTRNLQNSENQVAQDVKNNAKIGISKRENDECTTVGNDVQLKIPPTEVGFPAGLTYKVRFRIDLAKTVLHSKSCLIVTEQSQK